MPRSTARAKIEVERFVTLLPLQEEGMADGFPVHRPVIPLLGCLWYSSGVPREFLVKYNRLVKVLPPKGLLTITTT